MSKAEKGQGPWTPEKRSNKAASLLAAGVLAATGIHRFFSEDADKPTAEAKEVKETIEKDNIQPSKDNTRPFAEQNLSEKTPNTKVNTVAQKITLQAASQPTLSIKDKDNSEKEVEQKPQEKFGEKLTNAITDVIAEEFPQYDLKQSFEKGKIYGGLFPKGEKYDFGGVGILDFEYNTETNEVTAEKMLGLDKNNTPIFKAVSMSVEDYCNKLRFRSAFMDYGSSHNIENSAEKNFNGDMEKELKGVIEFFKKYGKAN